MNQETRLPELSVQSYALIAKENIFNALIDSSAVDKTPYFIACVYINLYMESFTVLIYI